MNAQVKTKKRIEDHGEVFTHEREVNAVLSMLEDEMDRIDSRFLEPACGTGNFLTQILERKLSLVEAKYSKIKFEFERNAIIALSSVYGVDLLEDNVFECRDRLLSTYSDVLVRIFGHGDPPNSLNSAKFILERNILWGDALTMMMVDGSQQPIVFSEWSAINDKQIKRRDYTLANLLAYQPMDEENLFSDLGNAAFIPKPIQDFPLTHFYKLADHV